MRYAILASAAALALGALAACTPAPSAPAGATPAEVDAAKAAAAAEAHAADAAAATAVRTDAGPAVYFVNLKDGDTVTSPFRVVFGLSGAMGVAPKDVNVPNTGHHHLLIDTELSAEEMKFAIPNDDQHKHYGGGQTETVLMLPAGQHTLQLVFGNMKHEQMMPPMMSQKITITVK